jgi:hypothetical protein
MSINNSRVDPVEMAIHRAKYAIAHNKQSARMYVDDLKILLSLIPEPRDDEAIDKAFAGTEKTR